jgi:hypothetical protein
MATIENKKYLFISKPGCRFFIFRIDDKVQSLAALRFDKTKPGNSLSKDELCEKHFGLLNCR